MRSIRFRHQSCVKSWVCICCSAVLLASCMQAKAQVAGTASIQGTIQDSSGAVIPNASVTLTNESTAVRRSVSSDGSGLYNFPNIDIGTYTVDVTATGFESYRRTGVVLEVGSNIAVNVSMRVGSAAQRVEVKSEALALQTEDVSFKQTIDQNAVVDMPLNGRQLTSLITLSGGATSAPAGDFTGSKYSYQTISVSIAGGGGNTTMWQLDGGDNNDYMANGNLPFPFPDAVSQFSVESTALGAQNGQHSGGLVNVVTRSGTNTYHGSFFEFIRNNFIDATNFFATAKDTLHQNQFGGTFGGPILRDKLFAFAAYQRLQADQSTATTQAHVPTAANLAGDFSVTDGPACTANGKFIQLVDPLTGAVLAGDKYPSQPTYNAQALNLEKYLPPINPAVDIQNCGLVSYSIPSKQSDNQFVARVDYTINARNNLFGRYFIDGYQAPAFFSPTNILITTQSGNIQRVQSFTLGEAFTISSKTVNTFHGTLLRRRNDRGYAPDDINATTLGVDLYQAEPNGLQLTTSNKFTIGGGTNSVSHFNDNTLSITDDVSMLHGKHQIVFGGAWIQNQLNIFNAYEANGIFNFSGIYSASGPNGGTAVGDPNLDFLMGAQNSFQQSKEQQNANRAPIPSLYIQDTYRATNQLTLVAGVRWCPQFMPIDHFNRGTVFNMAAFLANQVSTVYPNAPAGTFYYGDAGVPRQFTKNSPWQFSPNVGLTLDPFGTGKTVVRAGTELIYDQVNFFTGQRINQNPPFATAVSQTQTTTSGPISFSAPWSVGGITTSPFPQPSVPTPAEALFFPQSQYIVLPHQFHPSYAIQWTASVQQEFGRGWQFQLDYVGNRTDHAPIGLPISPAVFIPGVWGAGGTGCAGVVLTGPAAKPPGKAGTPCSTTANQSQRFSLTIANPAQGNQYLGGGAGSVLIGDSAFANYNGLVATLQHRLSTTFSLLANYTWSKCLNIEDAQGDLAGTTVEDPSNPRLDYGPCGSDFRNVVNLVVVAQSKFDLPRVESLFLNNWQFAPLVHIVSGAPFTVTSGQDNSFTDVGNDRPNLNSSVPIYLRRTIRSATGAANRGHLNPAAFSQVTAGCPTPISATCPTYGTYGNIGRNSFRGYTNYQFDAQVSRIFPIYERLDMTLRLEAFNVLNHPNFNIPTGGTTGTLGTTTGGAGVLTSATFGQISSTTNTARVFQGSVKFTF
jgi:hypothetical protein